MEKEKDYRELAIDALKESDICKGYRDYLLAILEITEDQALEELRHAVQVEHEEYEELKKKMKKIEQIVNDWNNDASHSFGDMCKINGILKEQRRGK